MLVLLSFLLSLSNECLRRRIVDESAAVHSRPLKRREQTMHEGRGGGWGGEEKEGKPF